MGFSNSAQDNKRDYKPIRWGIVGTARTAWNRMLPALRDISGHNVHAISGRQQEKTEAFARQFNIPRMFIGNDFFKILEDPEIDALYIPMPTSMHADWTIKALHAGKHVLCEKPMAIKQSEVESIIKAQLDSGKVVCENYSYQFTPAFIHLNNLICSKKLGEINSIDVHFAFKARKEHEIRFCRDLGGGSFLDLGCYGVDMVHRLIKERIQDQEIQLLIREPKGEQRSWGSGPKKVIDVDCICSLITNSGIDITILTSFTGWKQQTVWISGEKGLCFIPIAFRCESIPTWIFTIAEGKYYHEQFKSFDQDSKLLHSFRDKIINSIFMSEEDHLRWRMNAVILETIQKEISLKLRGDINEINRILN